MAYFDVEDSIAECPEVMRIPKRYRLAAVGLWAMCGGWLTRHGGEDRFVPDAVVKQYGGTTNLVAWLVVAELVQVAPGGVAYSLRRCHVMAPQRAQADRTSNAERQRRHREKQKHPPPPAETEQRNGVTNAPRNGDHNAKVTEPLVLTLKRNASGAVEHAAYVSDAREFEERASSPPPQDDPYVLGTTERGDLSPPISQGASRLVTTVLPRGFGNAAIRAGLRIEASALLVAGETEDDVAECLRVWLQKPDLGVKALKACMAEVHKRRLPTATAPKTSGTDGYRAALQRSASNTIEGEVLT